MSMEVQVDIKFFFKNMKYSENLTEHVQERIFRFKKHQIGFIRAEMIISKEKNQYTATFKVGKAGRDFFTQSSDKNPYSAVEKSMDKVESQMKKIKEKVRQLKRHPLTDQFQELDKAS